MREAIRNELKTIVVRALRVEDLTPEQIQDDQPLLGGDLGVDSIDVLQLVLEIEKTFGIRLVTGEFNRAEWRSIDTLAAAIEAKVNDSESSRR
jgi:acyl carrier protein